ncbi:hypothetical protein [Caulobacter sp. CCG-8]|uniref:hypothetical protein n=1 Tax=Caulobacter sp. CCG-8 TaxID=3127958 RepID=UPI00307DBD59
MNQTQHTPAPPLSPAIAWRQALQTKLMDALDAAWAIIERSVDPTEIRQALDRAKAIGAIAVMGRKVALLEPTPRAAPAKAVKATADLSLEPLNAALAPVAAPMAAQAEHTRRALEKLKGGRRGRP